MNVIGPGQHKIDDTWTRHPGKSVKDSFIGVNEIILVSQSPKESSEPSEPSNTRIDEAKRAVGSQNL